MDNVFDALTANKAQETFCREHNLPQFAPRDGICYRCFRNIYKPIETGKVKPTGFTVKTAESELITYCPHCNASFDD